MPTSVQMNPSDNIAAPSSITNNSDESLVKKIKARYEMMVSDRWRLEAIWRDVTALAYPAGPRWEDMESRGGRTYDPVFQESKVARRGRTIYDSTLMSSTERLTAGVESMITPQAQTWHGLTTEDSYAAGPVGSPSPVGEGMDVEEEGWTHALTNFMFMSRYDPRSGFLRAHQASLYSAVALGTGVMFCQENSGTLSSPENQVPILYQPIPLNEAFLGINAFGQHDTCFRVFRLSATQAIQMFGSDRVSAKIRNKANTPAQQDQRFDFLHAVFPKDTMQMGNVESFFPYVSVYIEMDTNHLIGMSGYVEFPYIVYTWSQSENQPYGDAPTFAVLPEAKSLQLMGRDALLASQNNIRPAVASAFSLMERPINLNPGQVNPNLIDPNTGRLLVQRIIDPVDPSLWETTREMIRNQVREGMYTNLFQVMSDAQYRSATEAAIRDSEKAELLGPASTRIQRALSAMIDREYGILERKGAFRPESWLAPPASMAGKPINVRFTSPIDRARRISEVTGMQQTVEFASLVAGVDPEAIDNFDGDNMIHIARGLFGAPPASMKPTEERDAERQARRQQENAANMAAMGQAGGDAMKSVGEGGQAVSDLMAGAGIDPATLTGVPGLPGA